MTDAVVMDTNVLVVANDPFHQTGPDCVEACTQELTRTQRDRRLLLDWGREILAEYQRRVANPGQGGVGTEFFKRAAAQADLAVAFVHITTDEVRGFREFPEDPELETLDRSDRKFVAVAVASGKNPEIVHATDRGWKRHREPLARLGIRVRRVAGCPEG